MKILSLLLLFASPFAFADLTVKVYFHELGKDKKPLTAEFDAKESESNGHYLDVGQTPTAIEIAEEGEFRVSHQIHTNISIQDEGPHYDLYDWRSGKTEWKELVAKSSPLPLAEFKKVPQPNATIEELVAELKLRKAPRKWIDLVGQCPTISSGPCAVAVGRHLFKIEEKSDGKWKPRGYLSLYPALGC
ncbi:MAG: hypothetical protein AB7F86_20565 [Bdellovibrionales bacterium]